MNNQAENRVETELNLWRSKEDRYSKLFGTDLSKNRPLNREKLKYYDRIALKYKGTQNLDEKLTLLVLKQERRRLEKQVYRFRPIRLLRRLLINPIRNLIRKNNEERKLQQNNQTVFVQLLRAGFKDLYPKVQEQMKLGLTDFTIPLSNYINEKERVDHQLQFKKDNNGQYVMEGANVSVINEAKPQESRSQYFNLKEYPEIDTNTAYNFLSGRAVESNGIWRKLDFTDTDADGTYKVKKFNAEFGFDLIKELQQLPLKEFLTKETANKLLDSLRQGNRQEVKLLKDGKEQTYYIEANPQHKSLNIFDANSKKVSISDVLGRNDQKIIKLPVKQNIDNEQAQNKRSKMKISR